MHNGSGLDFIVGVSCEFAPPTFRYEVDYAKFVEFVDVCFCADVNVFI